MKSNWKLKHLYVLSLYLHILKAKETELCDHTEMQHLKIPFRCWERNFQAVS